jgi:hypothetical protein
MHKAAPAGKWTPECAAISRPDVYIFLGVFVVDALQGSRYFVIRSFAELEPFPGDDP